MRFVGSFAVLLSLVWAVTGPAWPAPAGPPTADRPFALDLYRELHSSERNLRVSPSSLSSALMMTLAGARGRTATQIAGVLRVEATQDGRTPASVVSGTDRLLLVGNALWGQIGFEFRDDHLASIRDRYEGGFEQVDFAYAIQEQLAVLELPYEGERFSMVLLLPLDDDGLRRVEDSLTSERLAAWMDALAPTPVRVRIPRFTIDTRLDPTETLRAMGMTDAFTDRADFSGMSADRRLVISRVVQSVLIEVDENGTEGVAGSGVVIKKGPHPAEFVADRPFLFLVRDRSSGHVLFIGRVANPAS